MNQYISRSNGRIFINKKGSNPITPYAYHTSMKIAGIDKNYGEATPIYESKSDKLDEFVVYACGAPAMINIARQTFIEKGLDEHSFIADAFLPATVIA